MRENIFIEGLQGMGNPPCCKELPVKGRSTGYAGRENIRRWSWPGVHG